MKPTQPDVRPIKSLVNQRQNVGAEGNLHEMLRMVYSRLGDHGAAIHAFTVTLNNYRQTGKHRLEWFMMINLALEHAFLGNYAGNRSPPPAD